MIKVNLCPIDELENNLWYIPDVVICVVIALGGYFGLDFYFGTIEDDARRLNVLAEESKASYKQLAPHLERFKTLNADIDELKEKIEALQSITISKISKYRPLIALEHLQNLKPEGMWYEEVKLSTNDTYEIRGQAFDNILVAEFMTSLKATEMQEVEASDLRTQVYFQNLMLESTMAEEPNGDLFPKMKMLFPVFVLHGRVGERSVIERQVEAVSLGEGTQGIKAF